MPGKIVAAGICGCATYCCCSNGCGGNDGRPGGILLPIAAPFTGLSAPKPVGVSVGVPPTDARDASNVGGNIFGISNPRNFKFISLHAMLNSFIFILPSVSVSARAL